MNKLWIVTFETFLRQVKSWSFVMLLLGPFLMFGITLGAGYLGAMTGTSGSKIAVISDNQQLRTGFIRSNSEDVDQKITEKSVATKKMNKNKLAGYLVLKADKQKVSAQYFGTSSLGSGQKGSINSYLMTTQQQLNFANAKLSTDQTKALQQQPVLKQTVQKKTGTANLAKIISFWVTVIMVYIILITYTTITAQEIASEKGTKIMEIIFSSTTAVKYFLGKVFGVLLVILTQIVVYLIGGWGGYIYAQHASLTKGFMTQYHTLINSVLHNLLSVNLIYLLLGVVIYTILAAFSGALVAKAEDASKAAQPVIMLNMVAFFVTFPFQNNVDSIIPRILSYVPFLSSYFMPLRIINNDANGVEIVISILVLLASIFLLATYIGKIYQGLMLQTDDSSFWKRFKRGISYNK